MFCVTAAYLAQPWPLKVIFDYVLLPNENGFLSDFFSGDESSTIVVYAVATVLLVALVRGIAGYGQSYLMASAGQKIVADIRMALFTHLQTLSHNFHEQQNSGDLLLRMTGDIQLLRDMLVNAMLMITERLVLMVSVAVIMLLMDWRLALVALAVVPALALVSFRTSSSIRQATRKQRRKESKTADVLAETLGSIPVIQAFNRQEWEKGRFAKQHGASLKGGLKTTRLEASLNRTVEIILAMGTGAVLWFGVHRVLSNAITPGDLLVFTAYLTTLYKPIRKLSTLTSRLSKSSVCAERLIAIFEVEPEIKDADEAADAPRFKGKVEFDSVSFRYPRSGLVLDNANLVIEPGERVALIGPSGSGKSTIARLLLRFYDPLGGRVRVDDVDIRNYTLSSLRTQYSILMQNPYLFAQTIRENICYGRPDASDEEVITAARLAGAHEFIESLPDGYGSVLNEGGTCLSAGQRQRLAIARALLRDAPMLILDEPLTGLDPANAARIDAALIHLVKGKTCFIITHDLKSAQQCDRVVRIDRGRMIEVHATDLFDPTSLSPNEFEETHSNAQQASL